MPAAEMRCCYESNNENIMENLENYKNRFGETTTHQQGSSRKRQILGQFSEPTAKRQAVRHEKLMIDESEKDDGYELYSGPEGYLNLEEGHVLENRYEIVKKLGHGTFGLVYMAKDLDECETVALKIARSGHRWNSNSLEEVKFAKVVRGSNKCVKLLDDFHVTGEHGKHHVMVFEMLGPTLHSILHNSNQGCLTMDRLKKFLKTLLEGLVFVHDECGLIHCDMKPENIMITIPQSEAQDTAFSVYLADPVCLASLRIGDFGIAEHKTSKSCHLVQTCQYRAPEVFLQSKRTTSIDMWSMGCIAYELALQEKLFPCSHNIVQERAVHLAKIAAELGPIEADLFEKNEANKTILYEVFGTRKTFSRPISIDLKVSVDSIKDKTKMTHHEAELFHNFLKNLLCIDPKKRLTAKEALAHPFLQ